MPIWAPPLTGFMNWTSFTPVIPKFYWDVYSEEERIKKICLCLHKIECYLDYQTDTINKILEHYDDFEERITALEEYYQKLANDVLDKYNELSGRIDDTNNDVAALTDDLQKAFTEIANVKVLFETLHNDVYNYVDTQVETLDAKIDNIAVDDIKMYDPADSTALKSLAATIRNVHADLRWYSLNAKELDELELTAAEYDALASNNLTAVVFDLASAIYWGKCVADTIYYRNPDMETLDQALALVRESGTQAVFERLTTLESRPHNATITLEATGWSNNTVTVTVDGMTDTATVLVSPYVNSDVDYTDAMASYNIVCVSQAADALTFKCASVPTSDVVLNVTYWEVID